MKLFFDARFTRFTHHDGVSRYGAGLLGALRELHPVTALIHDPRQLEMLPDGIDYELVSDPVSASELAIPYHLNRLGADVVFSPMQVMGSVGRRYGLILTLHDMIYYRHPAPPVDQPTVVRAAWRAFHSAYWPQRIVLNRADVIATVSHSSKAQIEEHRLTRRPVVVVPNASDLPAGPAGHPGAASRDLLYMGSFMEYKNVETLLAAMAELPGYTLHLLSRIDQQRLLRLRHHVPTGAHVIFHDGVSDQEYLDMLRSAHALVMPSFDEGFGLPVVEAMSQGLPVVASDIPVFDEVGGAAAIRFPAPDPGALAAAIRSLSDGARWAEASRLGFDQAARFTWRRSAERLLATMTKVHEIRTRLASR